MVSENVFLMAVETSMERMFHNFLSDSHFVRQFYYFQIFGNMDSSVINTLEYDIYFHLISLG